MQNYLGLASVVLVVSLAVTIGDEPAKEIPEDLPSPPVNLDVEYAKTRLALAQASLDRAEGRNKKVANTVTVNVLAQYYRDVEIARLALEDAEQGDANSFNVWLAEAEAQWKSAHASWQSALAANKRMQGTVHTLDVERLRLRAELLRLNLARGRALVGQSRDKQLEWQLSALNEEIRRLSDTVFRTSPTGGGSRSIWYLYDPW
ncbi:MAG: hypothetical protein KF708_00510 [Pirellulales bacterium]|nr:hypothetical protein [Pirellulales bacterium]